MNWIDNMSMRGKLMTGFILVIAVTVVVGFLGIKSIHTIDDADTMLYEKVTVPLSELADMAVSFQRVRINLRQFVEETDTQAKKNNLDTIAKLRQTISEKADAFEKTILTDEGRKLFTDFKASRDAYGKIMDQAISLDEAGKDTESMDLLNGEGKKAAFAEQETLDKLMDSKTSQAKKTSEENTILANNASRMMTIFMVVGGVMGLLLGLFITRVVLRQLGADPKQVGEIANMVAVGDLSREIALSSGDTTSVMAAMKKMVDTIRALVADAGMLSKAAVEGKLATRADAGKHQGDFQKIVVGVNDTLDAVIGPLNVAGEYVDRISKGDIPPKITDSYNGDFNEIKNNLNQCIDAVNALVADANVLSKAAMEGKLATRADASKHQGDFQRSSPVSTALSMR